MGGAASCITLLANKRRQTARAREHLQMSVTPAGVARAMRRELFESLDRCEQTLGKQRYIAGNKLTEVGYRPFCPHSPFNRHR